LGGSREKEKEKTIGERGFETRAGRQTWFYATLLAGQENQGRGRLLFAPRAHPPPAALSRKMPGGFKETLR
jgi:hypothetical protein